VDHLAIVQMHLYHRRRMAWFTEERGTVMQRSPRHPVRQAVAKALIALANTLTSTTQRETQAAG
jgi:hypothetical protein